MEQQQLREQLGRQLDFVATSCAAYDAGGEHEAVRIATSLRVMLHSTARSTSLVELLGAPDVPLLSSCPGIEVNDKIIAYEGLAGMSGLGPFPMLDDGPALQLPAPQWWRQVVLIAGRGNALSRADIVLLAANKDGGAHVDQNAPAELQTLRAGVWTVHGGAEAERGPVRDHHFVYLRQMGYEILRSDALAALTAP